MVSHWITHSPRTLTPATPSAGAPSSRSAGKARRRNPVNCTKSAPPTIPRKGTTMSDTNIDHEDLREAQGAYVDEEYEKWLDERAEEFAILDDIETAERATREEVEF